MLLYTDGMLNHCQDFKMKSSFIKSGILFSVMAFVLNGCYTQEEIDAANSVISTTHEKVKDCYYMCKPWTTGYRSLDAARFELKLKIANMGGTHLVETNAYPYDFTDEEIGIGIAGEAYRCKVGDGPKENSYKDMLTEQDIFPPMPAVRHRFRHNDCSIFGID